MPLNLHSSMDRLEIFILYVFFLLKEHLHSSMDRLEIQLDILIKRGYKGFTFQYG